ncbi:MAG TPA: magnesium transporter [Chitinophagaceae bacterium]|nr:magnesium transporter [Chitinophagaceae bacterium]
MTEVAEDLTWLDQLKQLVESEDKAALKEFLDDQNISALADIVNEYPEYGAEIISSMAIHRAVGVFKILDFATQKQIISELPSFKTAELLNELPADDRTDFLEELPKKVIRDLIKLLNTEERKITLSLLGWPEGSVGRLMTPDYVYVYAHQTVEEVFATIRRVAKSSETVDVIYIINQKGELIDDIRIRDVILASPDKRIDELLDGRVVALNVHDDQEQANQVFKMNNRVALPVTDDNNILLGIVTIDDILWVANEEFTEDMQKMGGNEALGEPYLDISLVKLVKKRVGWLIALFLSEMLTASAMQHYQETGIFKSFIDLVIFIPLITSSGGNSGSQASSLIIQAMALGEVTIADWWRVMRRELLSGFLLGLVLGTIGFLRVCAWQYLHVYDYGPEWVQMATIIFFALMGIILWGSLIGSMLPIALKKLGQDPATSSAPFVATLVDVTGIIIYCTVASIILHNVITGG